MERKTDSRSVADDLDDMASEVIDFLGKVQRMEDEFVSLLPQRSREIAPIFRDIYGRGAQLLIMACADKGVQVPLALLESPHAHLP